jgi:hypothetical protein
MTADSKSALAALNSATRFAAVHDGIHWQTGI